MGSTYNTGYKSAAHYAAGYKAAATYINTSPDQIGKSYSKSLKSH